MRPYIIQNDKGEPVTSIVGAYTWLASQGYKHRRAADDDILLLREGEFFIHRASGLEMQAALMRDFSEATRKELSGFSPFVVNEKFAARGWGKILAERNHLLLPCNDKPLLADTRESAFLCFANGVAEVRARSIKWHEYAALKTLVPADRVINHPFELGAELSEKALCFDDFLSRTATIETAAQPTRSAAKLDYLQKIIGSLLHQYKEKGATDFAPIFCDAENGGSGKGLILDAITKVLGTGAVVRQDARVNEPMFSPDDLGEHTRLRIYNDVARDFGFATVYNEITESTWFRRMHRARVEVPWQASWKVAFTANYIFKASKDSDRRRMKIYDLYPYFGAKHTPLAEYGHFFFQDWKAEDWNGFYTIMISCLQQWLLEPNKSALQYNDAHYMARYLDEAHAPELREFADKLETLRWHSKREMFDHFKTENYNRPFIHKMTQQSFTKSLREYLNDTQHRVSDNHNRTQIWIEK